jgi:hypothetical protein
VRSPTERERKVEYFGLAPIAGAAFSECRRGDSVASSPTPALSEGLSKAFAPFAKFVEEPPRLVLGEMPLFSVTSLTMSDESGSATPDEKPRKPSH